MVGAGRITEEDGSLKEVGAAERLVKDWTGVGGVCLASFLETYRQIKISHSTDVDLYFRNINLTHIHVHVYVQRCMIMQVSGGVKVCQ